MRSDGGAEAVGWNDQCIFNLRTLYFCQGRGDRNVFCRIPKFAEFSNRSMNLPCSYTLERSNRLMAAKTPVNFRLTATRKRKRWFNPAYPGDFSFGRAVQHFNGRESIRRW